MSDHDNSFSALVKSLWEQDSNVGQLLDALEALYSGIEELSVAQEARLASLRSLKEIEQDAENRKGRAEFLLVQFALQMWGRVVLRTYRKVRDSLRLLFFSCNTQNIPGCALAARSIVEHVALLQYLYDKIPWRNQGLVQNDDLIRFANELNTLALGSRFDWEEMLGKQGGMKKLLASGDWNRPRNERIPEISSLIQSLDDALYKLGKLQARREISFLYTILCDVVHPSWGGDVVYEHASAPVITDQGIRIAVTMFCLPCTHLVGHIYHLHDELDKLEPKIIATFKP